MEEQHHSNIVQSLTNSDDILVASTFCSFNTKEVLRTTPLFKYDVNHETIANLKELYSLRQQMLCNKWHAISLSDYSRKDMIPQDITWKSICQDISVWTRVMDCLIETFIPRAILKHFRKLL